MCESMPLYLYHYTNIESLALILANHTIRLNRLDKMDDLDEGLNRESSDLNRNVYVSSWTDDSNESIPLWNLYTHNMQGVRIKLPSMFFADEEFQEEVSIKTIPFTSGTLKGEVLYDKNILTRVSYSDDEEKLSPSTTFEDEERVFFNYGSIGRVKKMCWEFQREWRYKVFVLEKNSSLSITKKGKRLALTTGFFEDKEYLNTLPNRHKTKKKELEYIDLKISELMFNSMEILLGPNISFGQELIVRTLLEKYNPKALESLQSSRINIKKI